MDIEKPPIARRVIHSKTMIVPRVEKYEIIHGMNVGDDILKRVSLASSMAARYTRR